MTNEANNAGQGRPQAQNNDLGGTSSQGKEPMTTAGGTTPSRSQGAANQGQNENQEQMNTQFKQTWNKLSNDDVDLYHSGKRDQFLGKLQEKHGLNKDEGEKKLKGIEESCGGGCSSNSKTAR